MSEPRTDSAASLRDALVQAVNGNPITPDEAWALIHKWDEMTARRYVVPHTDEAPVAPRGNDAIGT